MPVKIGLIDDHQLVLKSLILMVNSFANYHVIIDALDFKDLQRSLEHATELPEIMLIDVNMPAVNGIETASWLSTKYPAMKLVALSVNNTDMAVIRMIRAGCCAYLLKDTHPDKLEKALDSISERGFWAEDSVNINYRRLLNFKIEVTENELQFLQLCCSDSTYKQIAGEMALSERTIDGYRESLFKKFGVQSRVGLVLEAIRTGFVQL